jgi:hypothetical protein
VPLLLRSSESGQGTRLRRGARLRQPLPQRAPRPAEAALSATKWLPALYASDKQVEKQGVLPKFSGLSGLGTILACTSIKQRLRPKVSALAPWWRMHAEVRTAASVALQNVAALKSGAKALLDTGTSVLRLPLLISCAYARHSTGFGQQMAGLASCQMQVYGQCIIVDAVSHSLGIMQRMASPCFAR